MTIERIFPNDLEARLTQALSTLPEAARASLLPGAAEAEIADAEAALGVTLPAIVWLAYLRHNGQAAAADEIFDGQYRWMPLKEILRESKVWNTLLENGDFDSLNEGDVGEPVRMDWWNKKWVPVARSTSGDCICIDLDPGTGGVSGQMIEVVHDDEQRTILATDFSGLLEEEMA